MRENFTWISI